jgi:hypothetical protein
LPEVLRTAVLSPTEHDRTSAAVALTLVRARRPRFGEKAASG